ncbi:MAG: hypothetical protein AMXMBFR56_82660 [Polyangiaceae bacterium]
MAGMYEPRAPFDKACTTRDLNQGDLLANLVVPHVPTAKTLTIQKGNKLEHPDRVKADEILTGIDQNLVRIVLRVTVCAHALVLSNSCDNAQGYDVLLAPVTQFKLDADPDNQWRQISVAATGTANPKQFYLPDSPDFGLERSEATLPRAFILSHEYLQRCVDELGCRRVAGISPEAQRHLQWTIGLHMSRNPRDDLAWPSSADLELKRAWLTKQIAKGGRFLEQHRDQLGAVEAELKRRLAKPG